MEERDHQEEHKLNCLGLVFFSSFPLLQVFLDVASPVVFSTLV